MKPLPTKLYPLLKGALKDFKLFEKEPNCEVNMDTWHNFPADNFCVACLAGAWLHYLNGYQTLDLRCDHVKWFKANRELSKRMNTLDYLRTGFIDCALDEMDLETSRQHDDVKVCDYDPEDTDEWHQDMAKVIKYLKDNKL